MESHRTIRYALILMIMLNASIILRPFWQALVWAAILATMIWPIHARFSRRFETCQGITACLMTLAVILLFSLPPAWMLMEMRQELPFAEAFTAETPEWLQHPAWIGDVPWFGPQIEKWLTEWVGDPIRQKHLIDTLSSVLLQAGTSFIRQLPANMASGVLFILGLFSFLRHGEKIAEQLGHALNRLSRVSGNAYIENSRHTILAVGLGIIGSALAQGVIAGIGFAMFSLEVPLLLGLLTAIASMIPVVGTLLVWGPIAAWLIIEVGDVKNGFGLLLWGILIINPADNIIKPLIISQSSHHSLLLLVTGLMGGILYFGPIGLFVGPLTLTTLALIWREWMMSRT